MSIFIDGFALANYRSFGPDVQRIGTFGKINFFIGQNNSGKSNILLFLTNYYSGPICQDRNPLYLRWNPVPNRLMFSDMVTSL